MFWKYLLLYSPILTNNENKTFKIHKHQIIWKKYFELWIATITPKNLALTGSAPSANDNESMADAWIMRLTLLTLSKAELKNINAWTVRSWNTCYNSVIGSS